MIQLSFWRAPLMGNTTPKNHQALLFQGQNPPDEKTRSSRISKSKLQPLWQKPLSFARKVRTRMVLKLDQHRPSKRTETLEAIGNINPATTNPKERALLAWHALTSEYGQPGKPLREMQGEAKLAHVWPYGQVMAAALDLAWVTQNYQPFEALVKGLEIYKAPSGGYTDSSNGIQGDGKIYYDDNAWLGLNFIQAYEQTGQKIYLEKAKALFEFLESGLPAPSTKYPGALLWREGGNTSNTCSLGPTIELALRLHLNTVKNPQQTNSDYFKLATQMNQFAERHLKRNDGLYQDHINLETGFVEPAIYSYNQGTMAGANMLFYRITNDPAYLKSAERIAKTALDYFKAEQKLWKHPASFNAIFLRNLLALEHLTSQISVKETINDYLNQAWQNARSSENGLFEPKGEQPIGLYHNDAGKNNILDQAGLVQLLTLQAWPKNDYPLIA